MLSLEQTSLPTYWLESVNVRDFLPPAVLPPTCEVVVIGGGLMGISTAYWLAKFGVEVLVVESGWLSCGATGRNAGLMLPGKVAIEDQKLVRDVLAEEDLEAGLDKPGHLALASSVEVWEKISLEASRQGSRVQALELEDCEELLKMRIAKKFLGGRWFPDGCTIHSTRFVYGLALAAVRHGARIATMTSASEVKEAAGREPLVVRTNRGDTRALRVVYACNSGIVELLPAFDRVISPVYGQVLSTKPLPGMFEIGLAVDWGAVYWRQTSDGVIVLGGQPDGSPRDAARDRRAVDHGVQDALERFLPEVFPDFPAFQIHRRWVGVMDFTRDGKPIIGPLPGRTNKWVLVGFGGHGMPAGLGAGRAVAEGMVGGQLPEAIEAFAPARFTELAVTGNS